MIECWFFGIQEIMGRHWLVLIKIYQINIILYKIFNKLDIEKRITSTGPNPHNNY